MKKMMVAFAACAALCSAAEPALEKVVFVGGHPDDFAAEIGLALLMRGKFEVHVVDFMGDFNPPLFHLAFDANGKPYVKLPKQENDEGVTLDVLSSTNLTDFAKADLSQWTGRVLMQHDDVADEWRPAAYYAAPDDYVYPPAMFFKWRISVDN